MPFPESVRWIIKGGAGLITLLLIVLAVLAFIPISINLTGQKGLIEKIVTGAIGREFGVDEKIQVTTSLRPLIIIKGLRVGNPEEFITGDFARVESARVQIGMVPLLLGKIHIHDFSVDGLHLFLRENDRGNVNWIFQQPASEVAATPDKSKPAAEERSTQFMSDVLVVNKIELNRVSLSYLDPRMAEPFEFKIHQCSGSARAGRPVQLHMEGAFLKEPFTVALNAASLQEMIEQNKSWMEIETKIADSRFKLAGSVDFAMVLHSLKLSVEVEGERLESFNGMLKLDLPPFTSYGARATLSLLEDRIDLTDLRIHAGSSELAGKMTIDNAGSRPKADIDLKSPLVQVDDFVFDDWSPFEETIDESEPAAAETIQPDEAGENEVTEKAESSHIADTFMELLSPEFLGSFDARLSVSAGKVLSGADKLGSGRIVAKLESGRISIDPLSLDLPGGSLLLNMSVKPGLEKSDAAVRVKVHNFDIGVLARRADPQTDMGGTINLDINLKSSANEFTDLLAHGNGHFDFSASPENIRAGIIDLWAVNLISAITVRADKDQSQIECLLGLWSMTDGLLKPDVFIIDTSRMRICGTGSVDFKKEEVDLKVSPVPKKAEFFSLATPLGIKGKFSDFEVGIVPGGIAATAVKFISSPIHVPIRRLAGGTLPKDSSDVCGMNLGPDNRPTLKLEGCR